MKKIFILLMLATLFYAECPVGSSTFQAPAILGHEDGGLLTIYVAIGPGSGRIFTSTSPLMGTTTQQSQVSAVKVAFEKAGYDSNECNVYFDIPARGSYIEGPSAGALFTCGVYGAITNQTMRSDISISGTIDDDGNIGSVGGLIGKAHAASIFSKDYFITPINRNKDYLLISTIEENSNIQIVHIDNIDTLLGYTFSNEILPMVNYTMEHPDINVPEIENDLGDFDFVVMGLRSEILKESEIINPSSLLLLNVIDFINDDTDYQEQLMNKGYKFTSANNLFLHYTDLLFVEYLTKYNNFDEFYNETNGTLYNSDLLTNKTLNNFEYVIGGQMRYAWAKDKIENVDINQKGDQLFYEVYDLAYARAWLKVGEMLTTVNPSSTNEINENNLKDTADKWLSNTQTLITNSVAPSGDAVWHYSLAQDNFKNGQYIATIYECAFAQALQTTAQSDGSVKDEINDMAESYEPQGLWAKLYYGQGKYLKETGDTSSAEKLFVMSAYYDEAYKDVIENLEDKEIVEQEQMQASNNIEIMVLFSVGILIIVLQLMGIILILRKR